MTEQEIIAAANAALAEEFELELSDMVPEARFDDDLNLDSLDAVDMIIVLEQTFCIKLRDSEAIREIRTLDDLYRFLIAKKAEMAGA